MDFLSSFFLLLPGIMSTVTVPQPPQKDEEEEKEDEEQGEPFEFDDSADESIPEAADAETSSRPAAAEKNESQTPSEDPSEASSDRRSQLPVSMAPTSPPAGQEGNSSTDDTPATNTGEAARGSGHYLGGHKRPRVQVLLFHCGQITPPAVFVQP